MIDWQRPAAELARVVRAFSPSPGARTTRKGRLLKVLSAREGRKEALGEGIPGRVMEVTNEGFSVRAGEGRLAVLRVQPEGRTEMSAAEYVKGYRLVSGEELGAG